MAMTRSLTKMIFLCPTARQRLKALSRRFQQTMRLSKTLSHSPPWRPQGQEHTKATLLQPRLTATRAAPRNATLPTIRTTSNDSLHSESDDEQPVRLGPAADEAQGGASERDAPHSDSDNEQRRDSPDFDSDEPPARLDSADHEAQALQRIDADDGRGDHLPFAAITPHVFPRLHRQLGRRGLVTYLGAKSGVLLAKMANHKHEQAVVVMGHGVRDQGVVMGLGEEIGASVGVGKPECCCEATRRRLPPLPGSGAHRQVSDACPRGRQHTKPHQFRQGEGLVVREFGFSTSTRPW
ncbi:hypothetical protein B0T25DRAFT_597388 [Lasiosphaeria hispida]|uniref:Uncharacterized protein n=1 Tax=Lasiosphaeria hispida TaxID=260671 RepID=A0AAJ0HW19_9PEZI|nr:hypothetical protein B0T25DRAFT_597388 [Lasiosphaeria hispida]